MCWGSERSKSGSEIVRVGEMKIAEMGEESEVGGGDWGNGFPQVSGLEWGEEEYKSGYHEMVAWLSVCSLEWWAEAEWIGQVQRWRSQRGVKGGWGGTVISAGLYSWQELLASGGMMQGWGGKQVSLYTTLTHQVFEMIYRWLWVSGQSFLCRMIHGWFSV